MSNEDIHQRCSICSSVSNPEIAYSAEQYTPNLSFFVDPEDDTKTICSLCQNEHEDVMTTWHIINEVEEKEELENGEFPILQER